MCQPPKESRVIRICNGTEQRDLRTSFGTNMVHTSRLADTKKKKFKTLLHARGRTNACLKMESIKI